MVLIHIILKIVFLAAYEVPELFQILCLWWYFMDILQEVSQIILAFPKKLHLPVRCFQSAAMFQ